MLTSSSLALVLAVVFPEVLPATIGLYGAYWAFSIRRALASHDYRSHALWLGVLCIVLEVGLPIDNISSTYSVVPTAVSLGLSLLVLTELVTFFAFVDTMIPVARRSDPLLRGVLYWDEVRLVLWGDLGLAAIYLVISGLDPSSTSAGLAAAIGFPLFLLPFIVGAPAILIGARRSRDAVLRTSLKWIGGALGLFLLSALLAFIEMIVLGISTYDAVLSYPALVFAPGNILGAYCLYRSARSLAPMNTLSNVAPEIPPS